MAKLEVLRIFVKITTLFKEKVYLFRIIGNYVCILLMLSGLRAVSAKIKRLLFWSDCKGLKMKTYTLTWRHASFFGSTLSRVRFDSVSFYWTNGIFATTLEHFVHRCVEMSPLSTSCARLICNGRLVARFATYQGV